MLTEEQSEKMVFEYVERVVSAFERLVVAVETVAETAKYNGVREKQKGQ